MKNRINEASNGKLTGLTPISTGSGHKMNAEAAAAYEKMVQAAKNDGITWGITDSYRNYETQNRIFDWDYYKKTGKKRKKGTSGTPVAYPGKSNHGWGSAVDLKVKYGDKAHTWLTKNAAKFGFSNPFSNPRTEPWHWEHKQSAKNMGANITVDDTVIPSGDTSTTTTPTDDTSSSSGNYSTEINSLVSKINAIDMDSIKKMVPQISESITTNDFILPIESKIKSEKDKKIIFKGLYGVKVVSPNKGVVVSDDNDTVVIRHTVNAKFYFSEISGLEKIVVSKGQSLTQGERIGYSGVSDITFKILNENDKPQLLSKFYPKKTKEVTTTTVDKSDNPSDRAAKAISNLFTSAVSSPFDLAKRATKIGKKDDEKDQITEEINRIKKLL